LVGLRIRSMRTDPTHEAERFISLLWTHIYTRVRGMLHPHHWEHEPGGKDQLQLELGELWDCNMSGVADGQAPIYNADTEHYEPGNAGGGKRAIIYKLLGPFGVVAGDVFFKNLLGATLTISEVAISFTGTATLSIAAGGNTYSSTAGGLSDSLGDDATCSLTVASINSADPPYNLLVILVAE